MEQIGADGKAIGRTEPSQRPESAGPEFARGSVERKQSFAIIKDILHCRSPARRYISGAPAVRPAPLARIRLAAIWRKQLAPRQQTLKRHERPSWFRSGRHGYDDDDSFENSEQSATRIRRQTSPRQAHALLTW